MKREQKSSRERKEHRRGPSESRCKSQITDNEVWTGPLHTGLVGVGEAQTRVEKTKRACWFKVEWRVGCTGTARCLCYEDIEATYRGLGSRHRCEAMQRQTRKSKGQVTSQDSEGDGARLEMQLVLAGSRCVERGVGDRSGQ